LKNKTQNQNKTNSLKILGTGAEGFSLEPKNCPTTLVLTHISTGREKKMFFGNSSTSFLRWSRMIIHQKSEKRRLVLMQNKLIVYRCGLLSSSPFLHLQPLFWVLLSGSGVKISVVRPVDNIFTPLDASFEFLSLSNWVACVHPKPYLWIFKLTILFTLTQIARGHQSGFGCFALQQLRKCIKDCVHSYVC